MGTAGLLPAMMWGNHHGPRVFTRPGVVTDQWPRAFTKCVAQGLITNQKSLLPATIGIAEGPVGCAEKSTCTIPLCRMLRL